MVAEVLIVVWSIIVILLGFSFFKLSRRRREPTRLNMRAGNSSRPKGIEGLEPGDVEALDCWFNFNGHLWEAHEVLGVPAGSDIQGIQRAHQARLKEVDPSSRSLLDHALKALQSKVS